MQRSFKSILRLESVRHFRYLPIIISQIENWPAFFMNYLGLMHLTRRYVFRNGLVLYDNEGDASGIIAVVFIRKHYGEFSGRNIIVDIGANIGTFALYAASIDNQARIICYEPMDDNYSLLRRNIEANGLETRVLTYKVAVAAERGLREICRNRSTMHSFIFSGEPGNTAVVTCLTLQDVLETNNLESIDLLKMNCEGAEYEVLYSTPDDTLRRIKEIRMEYHNADDGENNADALVRYLTAHNYRVTHLLKYTESDGFLWALRTDI